jgi:hypothetical protein
MSMPAGSFTAAACAGWITALLLIDSTATPLAQHALGVLTVGVLAVVLFAQPDWVRAQTMIVVAFAALVEVVASLGLDAYRYRFHNVPLYVPPAHGLVYLAALAIGGSRQIRAHQRTITVAVLLAGGAWAVWGLLLRDRPDHLGAFWFGCLAVFLARGRSRPLFLGGFLVVSSLELLGTSLGVWTWQPRDVTGLIAIGNPPSGVAGGYGWFDLVAVTLAPVLLGWRRLGSARRRAVATSSTGTFVTP